MDQVDWVDRVDRTAPVGQGNFGDGFLWWFILGSFVFFGYGKGVR